jgi:ABC-type uncharacterized transport system permease subunit
MSDARHEPMRLVRRARTLTRQAHPDWIYFLPILHFCACLMSTLRYFVPGLQYLVVIWDFVMHADFPVSLLAYAAIWIVVAGTLWWYVLSRATELLVNKFTRHQKPATN